MLRYWRQKLARATGATRSDLDDLKADAARLRRVLDDIARIAEPAETATALSKLPKTTQWSMRPAAWEGILSPSAVAPVKAGTPFGDKVTVYHDCPLSQISLRQEGEGMPVALSLDILDFEGSYLSFAIGMDAKVAKAMNGNHLVRFDVDIETEHPVTATTRLNLRVGPNVEQINRDVDFSRAQKFQEFDLNYIDLDGQKISDAWIDLIFKAPAMNRITIRDAIVSRRPRANI